MKKRVSIVDARRELGRLADEVRRTRQPVVLTRRGRAVARITPEPAGTAAGARNARGAFAGLRHSVQLNGDFAALQQAVEGLRQEFADSLDRRPPAASAARVQKKG
jgi:prevent-host-death family protein